MHSNFHERSCNICILLHWSSQFANCHFFIYHLSCYRLLYLSVSIPYYIRFFPLCKHLKSISRINFWLFICQDSFPVFSTKIKFYHFSTKHSFFCFRQVIHQNRAISMWIMWISFQKASVFPPFSVFLCG